MSTSTAHPAEAYATYAAGDRLTLTSHDTTIDVIVLDARTYGDSLTDVLTIAPADGLFRVATLDGDGSTVMLAPRAGLAAALELYGDLAVLDAAPVTTSADHTA